MSEKIYPVPEELAAKAWINQERYEELYRASVEDPERFWREQAARLDWMRPFTVASIFMRLYCRVGAGRRPSNTRFGRAMINQA